MELTDEEKLRIEKRRVKALQEHIDAKKAFNRVNNTEDGKLVFECISSECLQQMGGTCDANSAIFRQGQQSVFAYIATMLDMDMDNYIRRMKKQEGVEDVRGD